MFTLHRSPGPFIVDHLHAFFSELQSADIPEGVAFEKWKNVSGRTPVIVISAPESEQPDPRYAFFETLLQFQYHALPRSRGEEGLKEGYDEEPHALFPLWHLALDLFEKGLSVPGKYEIIFEESRLGRQSERVEESEDGESLVFVFENPIVAAYKPLSG